ncbi:MAG: mechanosensitive ion channel family protein [Candidatus Bathyarchaeia archaeon]
MTINLDLKLLHPIISFSAIVLATWIIARSLSAIIGGLFGRVTPLLAIHAKRIAWVSIWSIGIIFALEQLGLRIDLLLLIVGLLGAAAIVANFDTLRNLSSKYFSDVYIPFKVGDFIKVCGQSGKVIEINPMSTILLTENEELVSIPNSIFLREIVVNATPHVWKEVAIPIVIDSSIDLAEFESEVIKSCNKLRLHLDERFPPIITVKSREPKSTSLILTLMIKDPDRKEAIVSEVNLRVAEIIQRMRRGKR